MFLACLTFLHFNFTLQSGVWSHLYFIRHPGLKAQVYVVCNKSKLVGVLYLTAVADHSCDMNAAVWQRNVMPQLDCVKSVTTVCTADLSVMQHAIASTCCRLWCRSLQNIAQQAQLCRAVIHGTPQVVFAAAVKKLRGVSPMECRPI